MKYRLLDLVCCPECGAELQCEPAELQMLDGVEEVIEGELVCESGHFYPVIGGIPRLLPATLLSETLQRFKPDHYQRYRDRLPATPEGEPEVVKETLRSFSYQWNRFSEMYEQWEENFRSYFQPLVDPAEFDDKLVLDAGCGFGRHAYYAGKYGAEVVAMDLSEAVETAHHNTREHQAVHVVQADIYRPPLRARFDFIYCVGVIQHLPAPKEGFLSLARYLKEGGAQFVWVYGKRTGIYRLVDLMRTVTTRIPMRPRYGLTFLLNIASYLAFSLPHKVLRRIPGGGRLAAAWPFTRYADLPLRVGHADWFDRLSVPSTVYFTRAEVEGWFASAGLADVEISSRDAIGWRALGRLAPSSNHRSIDVSEDRVR